MSESGSSTTKAGTATQQSVQPIVCPNACEEWLSSRLDLLKLMHLL